jgi:hypothetical protein
MSQESNHYPLETWEANGAMEMTADDWAEYGAYLDSLPGPSFPEPEPKDTRDYDAWIEAQAAELGIADEAA